MRARIIAVEIVKISVLSGLILVAIGCSSSGDKLAISTIPDSSLEMLYGGCGWFNNPYCVAGGGDCPAIGGCPDAGFEGSNCTICVAYSGTICHDGRSYWPDFDGCSVSTPDCPIGLYGYCTGMLECEPGGGISGDYPSCGTYSQCND
jgi:hypothetical protein